METIFSKEIQAGLDDARLAGLRKASRLRIVQDGKVFPVLRMWKAGFTIGIEDAPKLRGRVDLHDGANHLFQCLIVAQEEENGEMHYEFKRATAVTGAAPIDFERAVNAPVALIASDTQTF